MAYSLPIALPCIKGVILTFQPLSFSILGFWLFVSAPVWADVYRCLTDNGTVTLSNVEKGANCKKMVLPPPESKKSVPVKTEANKPPVADAKPPEKPKITYESAAAERKRIIQ